jgi:hypothetical protein
MDAVAKAVSVALRRHLHSPDPVGSAHFAPFENSYLHHTHGRGVIRPAD